MSEPDQDRGPRRPDFIAYNVQDSRDGKGFFNRVGAAWQHRDGRGYDLQLDSLPLSGRVTLRELREERMQGYQEDRQTREPEPDDTRTPGRGRSR